MSKKESIIIGSLCALILCLCVYMVGMPTQQDQIRDLGVRVKFLEAKVDAESTRTDSLTDIMRRFFDSISTKLEEGSDL